MVDLPPRSRAPGPLGATSGASGGQLPGPLGFTPGVYLAPAQSAGLAKLPGSAKQFRMPPPASDDITKLARNVKWTLFTSKGTPALEDVKPVSYTHLDVYKRQVSGRVLYLKEPVSVMIPVKSASPIFTSILSC